MWLRLRSGCEYSVFTIRSFWLLLLWLGFDGLMMSLEGSLGLGVRLSGFVAGTVLAIGLMMGRTVNAGETDLSR